MMEKIDYSNRSSYFAYNMHSIYKKISVLCRKEEKHIFFLCPRFFFYTTPFVPSRTKLELYLLSFIYSLDNAETQTHDDN